MINEKINVNEIIDYKNLEQVAGGTKTESYNDMLYLESRCGIKFNLSGNFDVPLAKLKRLFKQSGVGFQAHRDQPNEYYHMLTGQAYDRNTALEMVSRHIKESGVH